MNRQADLCRITTTTTVRQFITIAYRDHPALQGFSFPEFFSLVRAGLLDDGTKLKLPGCTIKLVTGATKLAMMARLHGEDDPFANQTDYSIRDAGLAGQIVFTANQLYLPWGRIPRSVLVPFSQKVEGYARRHNSAPVIGEILQIDPIIDKIKVIHINDGLPSGPTIFRLREDILPWEESLPELTAPARG